MNIGEMNVQEKSANLFKLMGWRGVFVAPIGHVSGNYDLLDSKYERVQTFVAKSREREAFPNLYDPANMALAWRVLNWLLSPADHNSSKLNGLADDIFWWTLEGGDGAKSLFQFSPGEAQTAWLDKILSLAIEAGMVEDVSR